MKRFINTLISICLILASIFSLISCSPDSLVKYTENEITYYLPRYMEKRELPNIPFSFSNNEAEFVLIIWGKSELALNWYLDEDFDIIALADKFVYYNDYETTYKHDTERGVITLSAFATEYVDSFEIDYFYNLIGLTDNYAYIVTLHCDEELKDKYAPLFEEWASLITIG